MKPAKMGSRLLSSIWQIDFNRYEDNSVDLVYLLSSSVAARLGYCENESQGSEIAHISFEVNHKILPP